MAGAAERTLKPCSFAFALRLNRLAFIAIQFALSVSFMLFWNLLAITTFIIQVFYLEWGLYWYMSTV